MKMASMRNHVRAGVLLTLAMVVTLVFVMTHATSALSQTTDTDTVRISNLDEPSDGYVGISYDQEYAQSFCTGSVAVTLDKVRMYTKSNGSDWAPVVTIRSDRSGEPGSVLDTLTNPLIDGSEATAADFTSGGYELTATTTYWVVVNRPRRTGGFSFDLTSSPAENSETDSDWAIGDQILYYAVNRWREFSTFDPRYVMRMAIYASRDSPSLSSPAFPDSDCNGTIDSYEFPVNESATANTVVGTVTARDDDGDSLTYSVGGADAAAFNETFAFDTSTGEITVKSGASIDYEGGKRSYSLTVSATDGEDASGAAESEATTDATVSVRIRVINVDEPGTVTLSQATPRVGSALLATLDDPDGWVVLSKVQWSRADTADGPFTVLNFKYISSLRNASYTPEAADEGQFLKVSLFYIDRQCRVVNSYNNQCRRMAEKTSDNAVAAAQSGGTSNQHAANTLATGGPGITGTAFAGEILTATTDQIEDEDGLKRAVFIYQWLADDAEISDATDSSYTVTATDEGNPIHVRVTFTDDAGNEESLTSNPVVAATFNSIATGAPTISGMAQVGQILTASTSDISDSDGLDNANFTYQWISNDGTEDSHIQNATGSTYTVGADDEGRTIKVRVSFADDRGNHETLTSTATAAVTAAPSPLTVSVESAPTSHNGSEAFRIRVAFSETPESGFSYTTMRDHAFTVTGGDVTGARRLVSGKNLRWEITVQPSGNADVTVELPVTTDCAAQGAICTDNDEKLSNSLNLTVSGPEATPPPAVVVSALTVSVESAPTSHNGSNSFRIRIALSEAPKSSFSYTTMRDDAFTVTGGDVTGARRLVSGKNLRWEITVQPSGNADVTVELPATTNCATRGAICTGNDDKLSSSLNLTVSGPN